jgi:hypothetical protein
MLQKYTDETHSSARVNISLLSAEDNNWLLVTDLMCKTINFIFLPRVGMNLFNVMVLRHLMQRRLVERCRRFGEPNEDR